MEWLAQRDLTSPQEQRGSLVYLLHEVDRILLNCYDASIAPFGLTRVQWWAVMHLDQNEGVSQAEFARRLQLKPAAAGKLLLRLEAKGWIERRSAPHDDRVKLVYALKSFVDMPKDLMEAVIAVQEDVFAGFSDEEVRVMLDLIMRLRRNILRSEADF